MSKPTKPTLLPRRKPRDRSPEVEKVIKDMNKEYQTRVNFYLDRRDIADIKAKLLKERKSMSDLFRTWVSDYLGKPLR